MGTEITGRAHAQQQQKRRNAEAKKLDKIVKHKGLMAGLKYSFSHKHTSHNVKDLSRDERRLTNVRGGIARDNHHQPVGHHRLRGHIDKKVASMGRGGDSRTAVLNNNSVARRKRDNDPINIDRPLG